MLKMTYKMYSLLLIFLFTNIYYPQTVLSEISSNFMVKYKSTNKTVPMDTTAEIQFTVLKLVNDSKNHDNILYIYSDNPEIFEVKNKISPISTFNQVGHFNGSFNISAKWLGQANVFMNITNPENNITMLIPNSKLTVIVIRKTRIIDHIFTSSVITFMCIMYIHFGCALDWKYIRLVLKKPVGPTIGFFCQFIIMPVLSFLLGMLLYPDNVAIRLGLFFTGVSPAGGASNIWTLLLGGNIDLSLAMTTVSNLAAFIMMPLWVFTLGRVIYNQSERLDVPYKHIATFSFGLIVPLLIGFFIQKYMPRLCKVMVKILKPFASCLLIFIIIFATITNTYLFELFTWRIIVAGLGLPLFGYILGSICAFIARQRPKDILAIGIETGVQNTGMSIFLLRIALPQPEDDLTTVIPVAVAIMTPFPLVAFFLYKLARRRNNDQEEEEKDDSICESNDDGVQSIPPISTVSATNGLNENVSAPVIKQVA